MKKTTIALLTAAAMGTSGAVMAADHGPSVGGRIDLSVQNLDGDKTDFTERSSRLDVFGSTELVGGLTGSYFARAAFGDEDEGLETNYTHFTVSGDFGRVQFGQADNVVYNFAGVNTDRFRELGGLGDVTATYGEAGSFTGQAIQAYTTIDMLTLGAYVDTANDEGIDNVQVGGMIDFDMGNIGLVYAEDDASSDSEVVFGASVDLDIVSIGGHYSDKFDGSNPFAIAATMPLDDMFSLIAGYGDDDVGTSDYNVSLAADLGGGLDARVEYRNGDSKDGVALNARYSF